MCRLWNAVVSITLETMTWEEQKIRIFLFFCWKLIFCLYSYHARKHWPLLTGFVLNFDSSCCITWHFLNFFEVMSTCRGLFSEKLFSYCLFFKLKSWAFMTRYITRCLIKVFYWLLFIVDQESELKLFIFFNENCCCK